MLFTPFHNLFDFLGSLLGGISDSLNDMYNAAQRFFPVPSDPLTLDLDGDGLETVPLSATNPILFDHNGDGIKTGTGWVKADDGFLALDRDGNGTIDSGRELFGDSTPLFDTEGHETGKAEDGFDALAQEDTNHDGIVNAQDDRWNELRIWQDANQNGICEAGELKTMDAAGIASVNVGKTEHSQILPGGNEIADLGKFTRTDGTTGSTGTVGSLADINLASDTFHRSFTDAIPLTPEAEVLPDMQGSGVVRDLREAASILTSQGSTLSALLTQYAAADTRSAQLAQLDDLLIAWGATSGMADMATRAAEHGYGFTSTLDTTHLARLTALEQFNGRGFYRLPWEEQTGQSAVTGMTGRDSLLGGSGNDQLQGGGDDDVLDGGAGVDIVLGDEGNDTLLGGAGDDLLNGEDGADVLFGELGNDVLDGGDDVLLGGDDNDVLNGGAGNDLMNGGAGDDTYYYSLGSGIKHITDESGYDRLVLQGGINLSMISLSLGSLMISTGVAGDELHLDGVDYNDLAATSLIDVIEFSNGQVMSVAEVIAAIGIDIPATEYADTLVGTSGQDAINALGGDDVVYAGAGNDMVTGGTGNDTLYGGAGDDVLDGGSGTDTLAGGLGDDTYFVESAGDVLNENVAEGLDTVVATLNTTLVANIENLRLVEDALVLTGTGNELNNSVEGNARNNTLYGLAGADILRGNAGNDVLDGGAEADILIGGAGDDITGNNGVPTDNKIVLSCCYNKINLTIMSGSATTNNQFYIGMMVKDLAGDYHWRQAA